MQNLRRQTKAMKDKQQRQVIKQVRSVAALNNKEIVIKVRIAQGSIEEIIEAGIVAIIMVEQPTEGGGMSQIIVEIG